MYKISVRYYEGNIVCVYLQGTPMFSFASYILNVSSLFTNEFEESAYKMNEKRQPWRTESLIQSGSDL